MNIELLIFTNYGINLVGDAVKVTSPEFKDVSNEKIVKRMVKHDYGSALEHISFTFRLGDISVALSREILEHRIASHTAKSTRYVSERDEIPYYFSEKIKQYPNLVEKIKKHNETSLSLYREIEETVDRENARYQLPLGLLCTYIWTINARSLINFLRLRLCVLASPEMQELAQKIKEIIVTVYPMIFGEIDCRGSYLGICPEPKSRSCGKYPQRAER